MSDDTVNDKIQLSWVEEIAEALEELGGSGTLSQINAKIQERRQSLSATWEATVRRTIQENSSDTDTYLNRGGERKDLFFSVDGLGSGVWGLRSRIVETPKSVDIDLDPVVSRDRVGSARVPHTEYRVLRDTNMARKIKLLHRDCCQICGTALEIAPGSTYSEAHHIIPIGKYNGPDKPGNILVLCPNHHALCDYGAIALNLSDLRNAAGHEVCPESIRFHNEFIFGRVIDMGDSANQPGRLGSSS